MTVVKAGSMGKAAERLQHLATQTFRGQLAELEHAVGVRLLDRHRQGVQPTEYGRALLNCGAAIFDDLRQGMENIEFLADPGTGECGSAASSRLRQVSFPPPSIVCPGDIRALCFASLPRKQKACIANCASAMSISLIVKRIGPFSEEQFSFETLFYNSYVVVAGVRHPWAKRRSTSRLPR